MTRRANERVRTVGVAFGGCTLPGRGEPLFTVERGRMEVGLGIHGEPGVRTGELLPAREVARLLVETILAEAPPAAGSRAAVLVNGLGATKYEELFVLYAGVAPLLAAAGIEVHEPHIGEFVTSLDMAGCSLTLFWLDDDLQELHDAAAASPAFTRNGSVSTGGEGRGVARRVAPTAHVVGPEAEQVSTVEAGTPGEAGIVVQAAVGTALAAIMAAEEELGRLDAETGDGDHGTGMARGFRAAVAAIDGYGVTARTTLARAGTAFTNSAGGASGVLVGGWLVALGAALPADDDAIDAAAVGQALAAGLAAVQRLGQATPGDKTLIDTLEPFGRAFDDAVARGESITVAWGAALPAAEAGMRATINMVSRRGRASRLGERSRGHQDAGATSIYYVLCAVLPTLVVSGESTSSP